MRSMRSYLAGRNKKNTPEVKPAQIQEVTSPLEKVKVFELVSNAEKGSTVDLREVCKQGVDNLQYLFNTSGLRI